MLNEMKRIVSVILPTDALRVALRILRPLTNYMTVSNALKDANEFAFPVQEL